MVGCEPKASCLTHVYLFSIPSREGPPAPNLGKCKIHLSHQGCQNWSAFPTRMMLLLRTRETGKKVVFILTEKAMAPHSSTPAWKIPWVEEPGRLQSMGSWRVRHDWATSLSLFTFMHWRRKWQPSPVSLPGESQGWGSLVGCHLWGLTELDTTEAT